MAPLQQSGTHALACCTFTAWSGPQSVQNYVGK
jgi:hypothetical protein